MACAPLSSPIRRMNVRAAIVVSILCLLGGCATSDHSGADEIDAVLGVCDIPAIPEGQRVKIRGLFTGHAHGVFLRDERCPGYMLTLTRSAHGPDTSLCTPDRLVQVFGCPGGNDNGPVVTVSGVLGPAKIPTVRNVTVDEMTDFQNVRTGERVTL